MVKSNHPLGVSRREMAEMFNVLFKNGARSGVVGIASRKGDLLTGLKSRCDKTKLIYDIVGRRYLG